MIEQSHRRVIDARSWTWAIVGLILLGAAGLSYVAPTKGLILVAAGFGGLVLLQYPRMGLFAIIGGALLISATFGTGTEVALNAATMLLPVSLGAWGIDMVRRGQVRIVPTRANLPLVLFLLTGLLSLLIGSVTWDPAVPRSSRFVIVQLAQWAIFAFAAGAFWLTANLMIDVNRLRRLTFFYLALAAGLAILRVVPGGAVLTRQIATDAVDRAPFWMLLAAIAGGQVLFNKSLRTGWRLLFVVGLVAALVYAFVLQRATASNWVGISAALGVLTWLRWPRLRWPAILVLVTLAVAGVLSSAVYDFAGGDDEWAESGGSRLALIERVIEVTMRNPVTGLGPAAYRPYAGMKPLLYGGAFWVEPQINSHNNYVDLFSHAGFLGLGLFAWFSIEVILLGVRLRARYADGFEAGYASGMLAAWAGALTLMLFADWILPFVYNIGFSGFQASVLVWLLLGGLVAVENADSPQTSVVLHDGAPC